jgi:hypothetical protein
MTGSPDMPGLTPRAIGEMFDLIGQKSNCTVRVSTYFVELYNDAVVVSTTEKCELCYIVDLFSGHRAALGGVVITVIILMI